jgi:hypothetical protein
MKKLFASILLSLVLSISEVDNSRIKNPVPIVYSLEKLPDYRLSLFYEYTHFTRFSIN